MSPPLVSVVMPTFNRERYIATAIASILGQHHHELELLVIDDGSTDRTPEIAASFKDSRVRLIRHEHNQGIAVSRNHGLALARGQYVANLDSDDLAHPRRLALQVAFLEAYPDLAALGTWTWNIDAGGNPLPFWRSKKRSGNPVHPADIQAQLLFHVSVRNSSLMGRTELLRTYGYREDFPLSQDYELLTRLTRDHRVANLPIRLTGLRHHPEQTTQLKAALKKGRLQAIAAQQLQWLGLCPSSEDLEYHYWLLPRRGSLGQRPPIDATYLDWLNQWFASIEQANRASGFMEPRALRHTLAVVYLAFWVRALRTNQGKYPHLAKSFRHDYLASGLAVIPHALWTSGWAYLRTWAQNLNAGSR